MCVIVFFTLDNKLVGQHSYFIKYYRPYENFQNNFNRSWYPTINIRMHVFHNIIMTTFSTRSICMHVSMCVLWTNAQTDNARVPLPALAKTFQRYQFFSPKTIRIHIDTKNLNISHVWYIMINYTNLSLIQNTLTSMVIILRVIL